MEFIFRMKRINKHLVYELYLDLKMMILNLWHNFINAKLSPFKAIVILASLLGYQFYLYDFNINEFLNMNLDISD